MRSRGRRVGARGAPEPPPLDLAPQPRFDRQGRLGTWLVSSIANAKRAVDYQGA